MSRNVCMIFVKLECVKASPGKGYDELYFKIFLNDVFKTNYPTDIRHGDVFKMNETEDLRMLDLDFTVSYDDKLTIELAEQDSRAHPEKDDNMGWMYLHVNDFKLSDQEVKVFEFVCEEQDWSIYRFFYRMVSQKLPTLRILGLYCQRSSCGCNKDLADALFDTTAGILSGTGKILGYTKNPETEAIAEALEFAGTCVSAVKVLAEWMANVIEGADDVYLQHTIENKQAKDHVAFCPPDGGEIKMNDGDKVYFMEKYGRYFRIPLDTGDVSIEARERDVIGHDASLGAVTFTMNDYNANISKGAVAQPLSTFYDSLNGEGCVYHMCYSFAYEDWTLQPNQKD